ncbi:MAG: hypothetical protein H0W75_00190, partial [Chitinophagaceae bacterium]|nr:hypothetical protein [Chitinophagaceae bacterium]
MEELRNKRIALLGNMNNNHFTLMRYMRDLGLNVDLLLFINEASHFIPECDTWEFNKWTPYIKQTGLSNGYNWMGTLMLLFKRKKIQKTFEPYNIILANGFGPALCYLGRRKLDGFIPYGLGGEFLIKEKKMNLFQVAFFYIRRYFQIKGIRKTGFIATIDSSESNLVNYTKINVLNKIVPLAVCAVYNREPIINTNLFIRKEVLQVLQELKKTKYSLFSHVSHFWKSIRPFEIAPIKCNDILIKAFAEYCKRSTQKSIKLFLVNYGPDLNASKELIAQLGIDSQVHWCPMMERKEIMVILDHVTLGAGEFGGYIWGGTGWEFLSKGI